jgi:hypothetical protein
MSARRELDSIPLQIHCIVINNTITPSTYRLVLTAELSASELSFEWCTQ